MGRPRKQLKDLPTDWEDIIISMMSEGASLTEVRAKLNLCGTDTYARFKKEYEGFRLAIKKGEYLSRAWWLEKGRINLENSKFSATLWYMNMKNRFGWHDKPLVDQSTHKHYTKIEVKIDNANSKVPPSRLSRLSTTEPIEV